MKRIAIALPLALLLGCSTPPNPSPAPGSTSFVFAIEQIPPPEFQQDLPLEQAQGNFCQLGRSCMAMDPRPFEACLVGGAKRCADKIREPLLVSDSHVQPPNE